MLKKVESTDGGIKEIHGDKSNMSQLVDSHSTTIKKLELQMGRISR